VYYFSCIFSGKEKLSLSFFKKQLEEDVVEKYIKINQLGLALSMVYLSTFDINKEKWIYNIVCIDEPIDIFYQFNKGEHICTYFNDLEIILRGKIKEMYKDSQIGKYINYYDYLLHGAHKITLKEIGNIIHFIESSGIVKHKLVELFQQLVYSVKNGNEKIVYLLTKCYINNFWGNDQVDFYLDLGDIKTKKYYDDILSVLKYRITYSRDENMVDQIVRWLFSNKDYENIISLYYSAGFKEDFFLFEVAYSLNKSDTWDIRHQGLKIYEKLLEKTPDNCAILNNLGCIYLCKENPVFNLKKAVDFYKQANEIDPQNKLYKKNLTRTSQELEAQQQKNNEIEEGLNNIKNESGISYILSRLENFQSFKKSNGFIICPGKQLGQYLSVPSHLGYDTMKGFLEKKYIFKVEDHNLDTLATVYRINPGVEKYLEEHKNILQKDREYLNIANKIHSENFEKLGLTEDLREGCCNIFGDEQGGLLYKELHECAMSRLTRQHKTTLILCGSIIESVLYMMIKKEYPGKFTIGTKTFKMKDLNLSSLLEIVKESSLITESQILHSFGLLKGWRNLIHPAFEEKKKAYEILKISQENADIARNLVIQTLKSLF
ncbi:MAG: tetratricopeptide repeat protein, partial [Candidatus Absconditicoccaceae bacterium]